MTGEESPDGDGRTGAAPSPDGPTTRQRVRDRLEREPATPSALGAELDIAPSTALEHVEHVARSLDGAGDGTLLVRPPTCAACGFDAFDDRLNRPSRCPDCRAERIREPAFVVEE